MRILSLELQRYGPFTNRTLLFNPTARLHVVHGRNATGKSCALAGITDLFFSIEPQTRYSFLHEGKTMRLGATLQGRNLSTLAFKRRKGKGNKNVLFTPAGESLDDNVLYPFLGDLTRGVFSHCRSPKLDRPNDVDFQQPGGNNQPTCPHSYSAGFD